METANRDQNRDTLLRYFRQISAIPRGSCNESGIKDFLCRFAEDRGLWYKADKYNNCLIKKAASKGFESCPPLLLQGHTDIVCEKEADSDFDFMINPLRLYEENGMLRAEGTTLGADDGVAVAYMLAILADNTIKHPPIECLFTSMEEIGLRGAMLYDFSDIKSRRMIGLDSGAEGVFQVASAGGLYAFVQVRTDRSDVDASGLLIEVGGLAGGHSGSEIHRGLMNANVIMGQLLHTLQSDMRIRISSLSGGAKSNAIPRECKCLLQVDNIQGAKETVARVAREVKANCLPEDSGLYIKTCEHAVSSLLSDEATREIVMLGERLPNGVQRNNPVISGMIDASCNIGVITTTDENVIYEVLIRGSAAGHISWLFERVKKIGEAVRAKTWGERSFPPYPYNDNSRLRQISMDTYQAVTGCKPNTEISHGGTECGVISEKIPGMDIVSYKPTMGAAHTPGEWLDVDSFVRTYTFTIALLETLARESVWEETV